MTYIKTFETPLPNCPHCGLEQWNFEYENDEFCNNEYECEDCGERFIIDVKLSYTTTKK